MIQVNPILAKFSVVGQDLVQTTPQGLKGFILNFASRLPSPFDPMGKIFYGAFAVCSIGGLVYWAWEKWALRFKKIPYPDPITQDIRNKTKAIIWAGKNNMGAMP